MELLEGFRQQSNMDRFSFQKDQVCNSSEIQKLGGEFEGFQGDQVRNDGFYTRTVIVDMRKED